MTALIDAQDDLAQAEDLLTLLFMASNDFDVVERGPTQALLNEVFDKVRRMKSSLAVAQAAA